MYDTAPCEHIQLSSVVSPHPSTVYVKESNGLENETMDTSAVAPVQCTKRPKIYVQFMPIIDRETQDAFSAPHLATTGRDRFAFDAIASAACVSFSDFNFLR